jgi:phosphohistidine phosphatase
MRTAPSTAKNIRVIVIRHGPAEERDPVRWPDDTLRPLTSKGKQQTRRAARGLARVMPPVARIASSAADRAVSTANLVRDALADPPRLETWPELGPGNLPNLLFDRLRRASRANRELALVGHEPTLAEFVGMAIVGDGVSVVHLTKGGAACLEFPGGIRPGSGKLLWLLTRKQLADEAG